MSAQRFVAANATDALRRIKAELGGDAVVLSSNDVAEGVEIIAIAAAELADLSPSTAHASPGRPAAAGEPPLQPPALTTSASPSAPRGAMSPNQGRVLPNELYCSEGRRCASVGGLHDTRSQSS